MTDNADWVIQDQKFQLDMEAERTRQVSAKSAARARIWQVVAIVIGCISGVAIIVGALWTGIDKGGQRKYQETVACTESGGTMVDTTSGRLCLRLQGAEDGE